MAADYDLSIGDMKTMAGGNEDAEGACLLADGAIVGEYKILSMLGKGGMGEVYLAENIQMHKLYALKVLPPQLSKDSRFIDRFRVEARVMADLSHPNIVGVHALGESDGIYYLVMDYIEGSGGKPETLEQFLQRNGSLPEPEARRIALQLCSALFYAHSFRGEGIVHRDLKPSNILLDAKGNAHISDFGLAKVVGSDYLKSMLDRSAALTLCESSSSPDLSLGNMKTIATEGAGATGAKAKGSASLLGTYEYMSPEQKSGGDLNSRSDLYALGLIIYRMLAGRKPEGNWKKLSQLGFPPVWDAVVGKCLEQDAQERCKTAEEVAALLSEPQREVRKTRTPLLAIAAIAILLLALFGGLQTWRSIQKERAERLRLEQAALEKEKNIADLSKQLKAALDEGSFSLASKKLAKELQAIEPGSQLAAQAIEQADAHREKASSLLLKLQGLQDALTPYDANSATAQEQELVSSFKTAATSARSLFETGHYDELEKLSAKAAAFAEKAIALGRQGKERAIANEKEQALRQKEAEENARRLQAEAEAIIAEASKSFMESKDSQKASLCVEAIAKLEASLASPAASFSAEQQTKATLLLVSMKDFLKSMYNGPRQGNSWTLPGLGAELVPIKAGAFEKADETVSISRNFWIGKTEVTIAQFIEYLRLDTASAKERDKEIVWSSSDCPIVKGYRMKEGTGPTWGDSAMPITCVSWLGACDFCKWLTRREREAKRLPEGYEYRLPTEAEWMLSCGSAEASPESAWFKENSSDAMHRAASKQPNALGLYDTQGNAWEWCYDWKGDESFKDSASDPRGASSSDLDMKIAKGGSFASDSKELSSKSRLLVPYRHGRGNVGFRIVCAPVI